MRSLVLVPLFLVAAAVLTGSVWCGLTRASAMNDYELSLLLGLTVGAAWVTLKQGARLLCRLSSMSWRRRPPMSPERAAEVAADAVRSARQYEEYRAEERRNAAAARRAEASAYTLGILGVLQTETPALHDLVLSLRRLVDATSVTAELQVIRQLEHIVDDVLEAMREDEPSLWVGDDVGPACQRFGTAFTVQLEQLSIRPTVTQRRAADRYANRRINRLVIAPPLLESSMPSLPVRSRGDGIGGAA